MAMCKNRIFQLSNYLPGFFLMMFSSVTLAAVAAADITVRQDKPDARVLFDQAVSLSAHGDWLGAEKLFKQISLDHPGWPESKNNLAIALFNLGKIEQAQQALEDAVTSLPSFRVAQENRKRLYDHSAAMAYHKAIGSNEKPASPQLQLLREIDVSMLEELQPEEAQSEGHTPVENTEALATDAAELKQQASDAVENAVNRWSKSWTDVNIDQYLSAYSTQFKPSDSVKDYTQWRNIRRAKFRLSGGIRIETQDIKVYLSSNEVQALVEFVQHYQSNKYQDKVIKQLHLVLENDRWLIQSERVLQQLN